jgi:hypothetical protein
VFVKSCILDLLPRTNHGHFELYSTPGKMIRRADAYVVPTESFDSESNPPSGRSASGLSPGRFVFLDAQLKITQNRVRGISYPGLPSKKKSRRSF